MRNFLFESIWLLSHREKNAVTAAFHPRLNLIVGRNHTGKSSIIKNLFLTMGAKPKGKLQQWDDSTISAVKFSVDNQKFTAVHHDGNRALFNDKGVLLVTATSHQTWTDSLVKALAFNLVLTDKSSNTVAADAKCFFIPFYINQDGSWQGEWDTFTGIQQYRSPINAILEYFCGIKPPEYYEIESKRVQVQRILEDLQKERVLLERARERFGRSMSLSGPKIDPSNFEADISRLTTEVTELNREQESLREAAVREQELLYSIKLQIQLAVTTLRTFDGDVSFLRKPAGPTLTCPTCGAEHAESFMDVLTYAEDARILRELVDRLHRDSVKAEFQYNKTRAKLSELADQYKRVSDILDTRRGELKFSDVVNSMGAETAFRTFEDEAMLLKADIDKRLSELEDFNKRLKELTSMKRTKEILGVFRNSYLSALQILNLNPMDVKKLKLNSRPDLSGSGGPRSILAYYAALWNTCAGPNGSFSVPLVIDAPNQQGQDDINLPKVLEFISTELPNNAQVIVGSELDTKHQYDNKILLDQPYHLLQTTQYQAVQEVIDPLVKAMYDSLHREDTV